MNLKCMCYLKANSNENKLKSGNFNKLHGIRDTKSFTSTQNLSERYIY